MPKIINFTEEEREYILFLYNDDRSYNYIAKKINNKCSAKTLSRYIKKWLNEKEHGKEDYIYRGREE